MRCLSPAPLAWMLFAALTLGLAEGARADIKSMIARIRSTTDSRAGGAREIGTPYCKTTPRPGAGSTTRSLKSEPRMKNGAIYNAPVNSYVIAGSNQPRVVFDLKDKKLNKVLLQPASAMRDQQGDPWKKIGKLQKIINSNVSHAGNDLSVESNPNKYTRFIAEKKGAGMPARLSDFLRLKGVVCRETAFLTFAGLQAAGFEARLVKGSLIEKNSGRVIGGHVWNEVKIGGQWRIVDTTNPQFNGADAVAAKDPARGIAGRGRDRLYWQPDKNGMKVGSTPKLFLDRMARVE